MGEQLPTDNQEIKDNFNVSEETIKRAELIYSQASDELGQEYDFSTDAKKAIEKDDIKNIKRLERLFRISEIKETVGSEQTQDDSLRTAMKISLDGRQPIAGERSVISDRASAVNSFVKELGYELPDANSVLERTTVYPKKRMPFGGVATSINDRRFIWLKEGVPKNPNRYTTIDHELLHTCQSPQCPRGLVEGITTLYQLRLAKRDGLHYNHLTGYALDTAYCNILEKVIGKESLAAINFSGDLTGLKETFKSKREYEQLIKSVYGMQHGQELYIESRKKTGLGKNYFGLAEALLIKFDALADIFFLQYSNKK
jgi:hypothetical protein